MPSARTLIEGEKPLDRVGLSGKDFLGLPDGMNDEMGNFMGLAQFGGKYPKAKPWRGAGGASSGGDDHDGETFPGGAHGALQGVRLCAARFLEEVSERNQVARLDADLVGMRLKLAQQDYEARYGKPK